MSEWDVMIAELVAGFEVMIDTDPDVIDPTLEVAAKSELNIEVANEELVDVELDDVELDDVELETEGTELENNAGVELITELTTETAKLDAAEELGLS